MGFIKTINKKFLLLIITHNFLLSNNIASLNLSLNFRLRTFFKYLYFINFLKKKSNG